MSDQKTQTTMYIEAMKKAFAERLSKADLNKPMPLEPDELALLLSHQFDDIIEAEKEKRSKEESDQKKKEIDHDSFEKVLHPLMKYLADNFSENTVLIVASDYVSVLNGEATYTTNRFKAEEQG